MRAGAIFLAWAAMAYAEQMAVLIGSRASFAGSWEISAVRQAAFPLLLALFVPLAVGLALAVEAAVLAPFASTAAFAFGAVFAGASAWGASFGRHFASLPLRAAFVGASTLLGGFALRWILPRAANAARSAPVRVALAGAALGAAAWWIDGHAFVHLYNGAHLSLEVAALVLVAALALVVLRAPYVALFAPIALALGAVLLARIPHNANTLKNQDNVRFVLVERAPFLGRAVEVASRVAPPPSLDDVDESVTTAASLARPPGEIPRALDWSGHDVVLLTIDAVRADHVGAYGYARKTTPGIDALAAEGTLFESAYCPTPHTSYSITSMMTGKYMRPLLSLGLGEDSETWADTLRRYDYRTAAFYPPAVFFVDQPRFGAFESRGLDFEYRRVEFRDAALRVGEVAKYLETVDPAHPLFLWVHLFEPHEPYIFHPEHSFGDPAAPTDVDRYDSEIATADAAVAGIVATVRQARAARGAPVFLVTADHGEEFGDHGGRYHGGDVFTEQVRVPLIVVGPGVKAQKVAASVQTIDLYPTTISALGIPRPARVRGGDLGPLLAGTDPAGAPPRVAFTENDDYARVTRGDDVLVCRRSVRACALYNRTNDPLEKQDVASASPEKAQELRRALTAIERENGRFERGDAADLPEPIRRGLQGDASAALDVAALLDDAKLRVRVKAAEVLWRLHDAETVPAMRRTAEHDSDASDEDVRRWCLLGLVRTATSEPAPPAAEALLHDADIAWRRRAALSFAERKDNRGEAELVQWWTADAPSHGKPGTLSFDDARSLLAAMETSHARTAAPAIAASLDDVRLRPEIARVLATLGVPSVAPALLDAFAKERYVSARDVEAEALAKLGAHEELRLPLSRFAGLPEPMTRALAIATDAHLLDPSHGGFQQPASGAKPIDVHLSILRAHAPIATDPPALRLLVEVAPGGDAHPLAITVNGVQRTATVIDQELQLLELSLADIPETATELHVEATNAANALWLIPRTVDLPPPAPVPWKPN